jgi:hypothetical protein
MQNPIYFTRWSEMKAKLQRLKCHRESRSFAARRCRTHCLKSAKEPRRVRVRYTHNRIFQIKYYFIYKKILNCLWPSFMVTKKQKINKLKR